MINKKSQITIFVIIAIVIVIGILIIFFAKSDLLKTQKINPEVRPIYSFVDECIKEVGKSAILDTSDYGGYFISPEESLDGGIPYYLKDGKDLTPSKEKIENEIGNYVDNLIYFCVGEFENFQDYVIDDGKIKTIVNIEKEKVVFDVDYPISITKGENTYNINSFNAEIPARLGIIYDSVKFIMDNQMKDKKSICITCLHQISESYDFYVNTINADKNTIIYTIKDENVKINDKPLVFNFVNELENL